MNKKAIIIFSKTPELSKRSPDEPYSGLPWTDLDALFFAMFDDVIELVNSMSAIDLYVVKSSADISNEYMHKSGFNAQIIESQGKTIGEEIHHVFDTMFSKKYEQVVILLDPNPLVTKRELRVVFDILHYDDDCIVVGEYGDGKYYLLGLKSNHSDVFENDVTVRIQELLMGFCKRDMMIFPMLPKYSLDNGTNLYRLKNDLEEISGGNGFSIRTRTMFKTLDKKYKIRRPH